MKLYYGARPVQRVMKAGEVVWQLGGGGGGSNFGYIDIAHDVDGSQTDFPVFVKPSAITGFGSLTLAEAQSLRFYADSAKTVELPREIVSADEIYVKNTLATGTGNKLYLDWDGVSPDYAVSDTYGARNVWNSNYKAVYHFEGNANDSTSNVNNGTASNVTWTGGYATFNGSNSKINLGTAASFRGGSDGMTIYVIGKSSNTSPERNYWELNKSGDYFMFLRHSSGKLRANRYNGSSNFYQVGTTSLSNNIDYHIHYTSQKSETYSLYVNGNLDAQMSISGNYGSLTYQYGQHIGTSRDATGEFFNGSLKMLYIANIKFPHSRISTEYANQSNPATFFGSYHKL